MYKLKTMRPVIQSVGIIAAVMVLVTGVTFAALQSQQVVLKGNTIQTAMADLKISKDAVSYATSLDGYNFNNMIPGGGASPAEGNPVYLLNTGSTTLALKLSVASGLSNPNSVDLSKVHVTLTPMAGGAPQSLTLQDLIAASTTGGIPLTVGGGGALAPNFRMFYAMRIVMDADATTSSSAVINNLVFKFDATAVS